MNKQIIGEIGQESMLTEGSDCQQRLLGPELKYSNEEWQHNIKIEVYDF